jgi:hypothetical protein
MKPETERLLEALCIEREILIDFFVMFSRFEYSLKRASFLRSDTNYAAPDWRGFARTTGGAFRSNSSPQLQESVNYLLVHPPKRQVQDRDGLKWEDEKKWEQESEFEYLIRLVCQVRNNFFHGGKYPIPNEAMQDVGRDKALVDACVVVLDYCLGVNSDVRHFFNEFP